VPQRREQSRARKEAVSLKDCGRLATGASQPKTPVTSRCHSADVPQRRCATAQRWCSVAWCHSVERRR